MQDTSTLEIDLGAIDHNMSVIRGLVGPSCRLCPIVKADAYGLGVSGVARRLVGAGADMLAVYSLRQAIETAAAVNASTPVLVLMPVSSLPREDEIVRLMLAGRLHLVVHDEANLEALDACVRALGVELPVHVEVDVGMSRGGARPEEASRLVRALAAHPNLRLAGIFAHFSNSRADSALTARQLEAFDMVVAANRRFIPDEALEHVASTYALARARRYHRSMVRFGLAWLGYGLEELCGFDGESATDRAPLLAAGDLHPVVRWTSRVVQSKSIAAGTPVGYGSRWIAERPSTVLLVPVGYADGYPVARDAHARQYVRLRTPAGDAVDAPVVGAINMDQITVDATGFHAGDHHDWIGCEVELISRNAGAPNSLPALAARSGMIPHELLTRINPRVPRISLSQVSIEVVTHAVETSPRSSVAAG